MASDIQTYLRELQAAMVTAGADPALVQDALFDAEEHLQAEMASGAEFATVVEGYGSPQEVTAAYLGVAPAHEVVAAYEVALANGSAAVVAVEPGAAETPALETAAETPAETPTGRPLDLPAESAPQATVATSTRFCTVCGGQLRPGSAFCTSCGAPVAMPAAAAASAAGSTGAAGAGAAGGRAESGTGATTDAATGGPAVPSTPVGVQAGMAAAAAGAGAPPSALRQVFGVFADPAVYKALLYMLLSLGTGIAYFTIVVTGVSTFVPLLIMIIGIPLFLLFLGAVRGIALFEGRLVELLLGVRMPRRPRATPPNTGLLQRVGFWLKDGRTWASMVYLVLMLPLGVAYFTIAVTGLATGIGLLTSPLWAWASWVGDRTVFINGVPYEWTSSPWWIPVGIILGALILIGMMHLIKWIGRGHAAFAKAMLVRLAK